MLAAALMPAARSAPGGTPRRRSSDERIEELLIGQGRIEERINAASETAATQSRSIEKALDLIQKANEDANNTPAGRELLRKSAANSKAIGEHETRIADLEDFRLEVRSAVRWFKGTTGAATTIAAIASALWTAHLFHWFGL